MRSSNAKAATSHLKRTEGMFVKEACRFETGEDLDDPCARLKTHFRKHRMGMITCRNNPNKEKKMASEFDSHLLFTESVKMRNFQVSPSVTHVTSEKT